MGVPTAVVAVLAAALLAGALGGTIQSPRTAPSAPPAVISLGTGTGQKVTRATLLISLDGGDLYAVEQGVTRDAYSAERLALEGSAGQLSDDGGAVLHLGPGCTGQHVFDLTSRRSTRLPAQGCAALAPGGRSFADIYYDASWRVRIVELHTGASRQLPYAIGGRGDHRIRAHGWSPDGLRLAVGVADDAVDLLHVGTQRKSATRVRGALVNGSLSWSPDSRWLLLSDAAAFRYLVTDGATTRPLRQPSPEARPVGWTGARIVWMAGYIGDQRLVTTDISGAGPRAWLRFDVGSRAVLAVAWPDRLTAQ